MARPLKIGKHKTNEKRFKSAKETELSVSDKNLVRKNIDKFSVQQLAMRIGKSKELIEKFLKKEKLIPILSDIKIEEIQEKEAENIDPVVELVEKEKKDGVLDEKLIVENFEIKLVHKSSTVQQKTEKTVIENKHTPENNHFKNYLLANYKNKTAAQLSEDLNISLDIVRYHLRKLNVTPLSARTPPLPEKTVAFLKKNYRTMTAREMSEALGDMTFRQVVTACVRLKLIRTPEETTAIRLRWNKIYLTDEEKQFIRENYGKFSRRELTQKIGKGRGTIDKFIASEKLYLKDEQKAALNRRNFEIAREKLKTNEISTPKNEENKIASPLKIENATVIEDNGNSSKNDVWVFNFDKVKKKKKKK